MKIRVTYTIVVDTDEETAPKIEAALKERVTPFDPSADVDETDCEELEDEDEA